MESSVDVFLSHPEIFAPIITFTVVVILVIWAATRERKRRARMLDHAAQLHAYAAELGLYPIASPVTEAMRWRPPNWL